MLNILPVTNAGQVTAIKAAAEQDNHYVFAPTHSIIDDNSMVRGYLSAGIIPVAHFWLHSSTKPRVSYQIVKQCEEVMRKTWPQHPFAMIACQKSSPFHPTLSKHFGFSKLITTDLFCGKL